MATAIPRGVLVANFYALLPRGLQSSTLTAAHAARTNAVSWSSILPSASITIPAITLNIPDAIYDIWEGILRAVPKKKTSHMKKRHRQLAGKALKDVKLVRCPACGKPKKAHCLCPYCVAEIKDSWRDSGALLQSPPKQAMNLDDQAHENQSFDDSIENKRRDIGSEEIDQGNRSAETYTQKEQTKSPEQTGSGARTVKEECSQCGKLISKRNIGRHHQYNHPEAYEQYLSGASGESAQRQHSPWTYPSQIKSPGQRMS